MYVSSELTVLHYTDRNHGSLRLAIAPGRLLVPHKKTVKISKRVIACPLWTRTCVKQVTVGAKPTRSKKGSRPPDVDARTQRCVEHKSRYTKLVKHLIAVK